jgi:hypothetical protein
MKTRTKRLLGKKRITISLEPDLLRKGGQRAQKARRNFSNYVEVLIASDLATATEEAAA